MTGLLCDGALNDTPRTAYAKPWLTFARSRYSLVARSYQDPRLERTQADERRTRGHHGCSEGRERCGAGPVPVQDLTCAPWKARIRATSTDVITCNSETQD